MWRGVCACVSVYLMCTYCSAVKQIKDEGDGAAVDANEEVDT